MTDRLYNLLRRVTSSGRFIPEVDGPIAWMMGTGWMGVRLFFAISGFILALPFAEQYLAAGRPLRLGAYFTRRLTRLEPPFVVCLLLLFGLQLARFGSAWWEQTPHLFASLTYTHTLIYNAFSPINVVIWSLEVEVQFYLLMPVLAMAYRIGSPATRRTLLAAGVLGLSAASVWLAPQLPLGVQNLVIFHLPYFLVGLLLADLHVTRWKSADRTRARAMDGLALLAVPAIFAATVDPLLLLLAPWFVFLAFAAALRGRAFRAALSNRWVVVIGGMCYTIYLYHFTVIKGLSRATLGLTDGWPLWAALLFQAVVCIEIGRAHV